VIVGCAAAVCEHTNESKCHNGHRREVEHTLLLVIRVDPNGIDCQAGSPEHQMLPQKHATGTRASVGHLTKRLPLRTTVGNKQSETSCEFRFRA
jgi:hypothetical protein